MHDIEKGELNQKTHQYGIYEISFQYMELPEA
jgi:hypothetical protein